MTTTQHPLTETDAAGLWDGYLSDDYGVWHRQDYTRKARAVDALRAAFDAGREHERTTPADPRHDPRPWQDCTREDIREGDLVEAQDEDLLYVGRAHHQDGEGDWRTEDSLLLAWGARWPLRRIPARTTEKGTPMPETTTPVEPLARTLLAVAEGHGAPHHDADRINPGDYVLQVDQDGFIRAGRAHHQDEDGDWLDEDGAGVTWAHVRADRPDAITVWPAPTPPAEEVELPGEGQETSRTNGIVVTVYDSNPNSYQPVHVPGQIRINGRRVYVTPGGFTVSTDERGTPIVTLSFRPAELRFIQEGEK